MSELVLQTRALQIVNSGGGVKQRTFLEIDRNPLGKIVHKAKKQQNWRAKGADYHVWRCLACGTRNRHSAFEASGKQGEALLFRCKRCYRRVEVVA